MTLSMCPGPDLFLELLRAAAGEEVEGGEARAVPGKTAYCRYKGCNSIVLSPF